MTVACPIKHIAEADNPFETQFVSQRYCPWGQGYFSLGYCPLGTMSASLIGRFGSSTFRLSTTTVSMSLTGSCFSSESAPRALPSWNSRTRRSNLLGGLAVRLMAGPTRHTNSPHSSSREGRLSTARWGSGVLLLHWELNGSHAATAACSRLQRNSVPSTHMRCMITANRRASATIAFFIPRCLAIFIAQTLSNDHLFERSMLCAAS